MLCEDCKVNQATVSMTFSINGVIQTRHLCPECVKKAGIGLMEGKLPGMISSALASLLSGKRTQEAVPDIICNTCGCTYAQYLKTGHLECADCYNAFAEPLKSILSRPDEQSQPVPESEQSPLIERLTLLRKKLEEAVAAEAFEEAAEYRDEIRALTAEGGASPK